MNRKTIIDVLTAVMSVMTVLAGIPYEKQLIEVVPPKWAPHVTLIGAVATIVLRCLRPLLIVATIKPTTESSNNVP